MTYIISIWASKINYLPQTTFVVSKPSTFSICAPWNSKLILNHQEEGRERQIREQSKEVSESPQNTGVQPPVKRQAFWNGGWEGATLLMSIFLKHVWGSSILSIQLKIPKVMVRKHWAIPCIIHKHLDFYLRRIWFIKSLRTYMCPKPESSMHIGEREYVCVLVRFFLEKENQ